jgi:hypothetical protein
MREKKAIHRDGGLVVWNTERISPKMGNLRKRRFRA